MPDDKNFKIADKIQFNCNKLKRKRRIEQNKNLGIFFKSKEKRDCRNS